MKKIMNKTKICSSNRVNIVRKEVNMKFLISVVALVALSIPASAEAHSQRRHTNCACSNAHTTVPAARPKPATAVVWVWVPPHRTDGRYVRGHWSHPQHGKEYTNQHSGRPSARPPGNVVWVPGHWEGQGRREHWVSGRWKVAPSSHSSAQSRRH